MKPITINQILKIQSQDRGNKKNTLVKSNGKLSLLSKDPTPWYRKLCIRGELPFSK